MDTITSKDGTPLYYKDWGRGPVVTFSHGWPLNADAWDGQMLFLVQNGFRVIAHDRRGHGRSGQASSGNDMNGYADDLAAVIETLDLRNVTLVGHSTGGGEVVRYIGRHGTKRVVKAVLIAAVPPLMLKTAANPEGLPLDVFDSIRAGVFRDRAQFYKDLAIPFYGANRPGANVSQGVLDQFWLWSMQSGLKNAYDSIKAFSETDFTEDLKKIDVPTLVLHGEDDQIVPVNDSARKSARLIKGAKDIYYPGAPHGLTTTHQDQVNSDLLAKGNPFQSGNLAMTEIHTWYSCCVNPAAPAEPIVGDDFGWAVAPSFDGNTTAKLHADTFSMLKTTKHPDEAFAVLSALAASGELATIYGAMPADPAQTQPFKDAIEAAYPKADLDWAVPEAMLGYPDIPNHQAWVPDYAKSKAAWQAFGVGYRTAESADIDADLDTLQTTLQGIFDAAPDKNP